MRVSGREHCADINGLAAGPRIGNRPWQLRRHRYANRKNKLPPNRRQIPRKTIIVISRPIRPLTFFFFYFLCVYKTSRFDFNATVFFFTELFFFFSVIKFTEKIPGIDTYSTGQSR